VVIDTAVPDLTVTAPLANELVGSSSYTIRGQVTDNAGKGVTALAYSRDNSTWTPITLSGLNWSAAGIDFSAAVGAEAAQGARTLYLRATDGLNGYATVTRSFYYDTDNPVLTETTSGLTSALVNRKTAVNFGGAASDTNSLSSVKVSVNGATAVDVTGPLTAWSYTLPATTEGTFEIVFTATDVAGRTTSITRNVVMDTTAPGLPVFTSSPGNYVTTSLAVGGTAADSLSGVASVYYRLNGIAGDAATGSLTGTNDWFGTIDVSGLGQGGQTVYVWTLDKSGNKSAEASQSFTKDTANPVISETDYTGTVYKTANFNITVTVTDTRLLGANPLTVSLSAPSGASLGTLTAGASSDTSKTFTQAVTAGDDGTYIVTFDAVDAVGRSATTITRTVTLDKTQPAITLSTINGGASGTFSAWKGTSSLSVTGTASDATSGLALIEYSTDGTNYNALSGTTAWSGSIPVADGSNTIRLRATDKAGNTLQTTQVVSIDLTSPVLTVNTPATLALINKSNGLATAFLATDTSGSGVGSVTITKIGAVDITDVATTRTAGDAYSGNWTATIPTDRFTTLVNGQQYSVEVVVTDAVGNTSTGTFPIAVDTQAPSVSFSAPLAPATVNKLIDISGTASDNQSLSSVVISLKQGTADSWTELTQDVTSTAFSWLVKDFNTDNYDNDSSWDSDTVTSGIQLTLRAVATDAAQNATTVTCTVKVDQDTDRPTVKLSNVNVDGSTILKMTNVVFGSVSDDDGVSLLEISETGTFSDTASDDVTLDGVAWSYTSSDDDGIKTIYFRVTDTEGTVFTTIAANDTAILTEPKVQYNSTFASSSVSYRVDTVTPELGSTVYTDRTSSFDYADKVALTNNMPFGGTVKQFSIGITATDANGIQTVKVTVPGAAATPYTATGTYTNAPIINAIDIKKGGEYRVETIDTTNFTTFGASANTVGTVFTANRDGTGTDLGTVRGIMYVTPTIDVTLTTDGYVQATIEVTDNSGLKATATRTILIDNTVPTLTHQSPILNATVNGEIEVKGLADDGLGSGIKSVQYKVGYNYASESWTAVSSGTLAWQINFDGSNKIDIYAVPGDGIEGTGADAGLWTVPILMRIEDYAGNVYTSTDSTYTLKVDPNGDRPKVTVVYPDPASSNRTLGGIIRVFGSSEDDDAVASVWMQIDVNNDGAFDSSDVVWGDFDSNSGTPDTSVDWYNGGDGQPMTGTISWNRSINTAGEFNPSGATEDATGIKTGIRYRIVTPGTTAFSGAGGFGAADDNADTEFTATRDGTAGDGTGTVIALINRINFRVRARDINATPVNGTWVGPYVIDIDKNVPKIGSSDALTLTQGSTVQGYVADMWVKDDWTLGGSVEDESGISNILVTNYTTGATIGSLAGNPTWFIAGTDLGGGKYNYTLAIPIDTVAGNTGTVKFNITAYDNNTPQLSSMTTIAVNYDNEPSTMTTLTNSSAAITTLNPVVQSNNIYTIDSSVTESGSGFQRVAYYFVRDVGTDGTYYEASDRVYNPMESKTGNANRTYMNTLTEVDGLPRLHLTGAGRPDDYTLVHASLYNNKNVRKGGLVKIGGIDRLITAVNYTYSGTEGSIQWADAVSMSVTTADAAYALVVDNLKTESPVWSGDTIASITNDDGDWLVESVTKAGGLYTWSSSFNSRNIPDGPIEINYVAYDKAGNYVTGKVDTSVQNNRPMLAAVTLGTDLNGNNAISSAEKVAAYSALDPATGLTRAVASIDSGAFKAKGRSSVDIDVVGGNGSLKYVLTENGSTVHSLSNLRSGTEVLGVIDTGTDLISATAHGFTDGQLVYMTATTLPTTSTGTTVASGNYYVRDVLTDSFRIASSYGGTAINFGTQGTTVNFSSLGTIFIEKSEFVTIGEGSKSLVFKIWDSTEETVQGSTSQWCELTVPLIVDVIDQVGPKAVISPFFWSGTGNGNNSLYNGLKDNGHVELAGDLPATPFNQTTGEYDRDPKVSGKISIRGTLYDDKRITSLWMFIGNGTTGEFTFPNATVSSNQFDTDSSGTIDTLGRTYYRLATYNTTTNTWDTVSASVDATEGWAITVADDYLNQDGHKASWRLDWNTAKISGVSVLDRQVRVIAVDSRGELVPSNMNASSETANATADIGTNNVPSYQMDIVPYIKGIDTFISGTAGSEFARAAKGAYSVAAGSTVTVNGFNFTGTSTTVKAGTTTLTVSVGTDQALTTAIGTTAVSSAVTASNGTIVSLNNANVDPTIDASGNVTAYSYNSQANGVNNDRLTDNVSLYIWDMGDFGIGLNVTSPVMKMNAASRYFLSYGEGVPAMVLNNNGTRRQVDYSYNKFQNTMVAFDTGNNIYGFATNTDRIDDTSAKAVFYTENTTSVTGNTAYTSSSTYKRHMERVYNSGTGIYNINRVQRPKMTVTHAGTAGDPARVYMSYFDSNNTKAPVKFRYGTVATLTTITGGIQGNTNSGAENNDPAVTGSSATGFHIVASDDTTYKGGQYTSVGATSGNVAVVAWYDASQRRLMYSYNTAPATPVVGDVWQTHAIVIDSSYSGWYVDLAVDSADGIHIAYYNSAKGDLKYAYLPTYDSTSPTVVTVDSYLATGTQITINVRDEVIDTVTRHVPYISYFHSSFTQTPSSIRVAWRTDFSSLTNGATSDKFTGGWEVMTVPTENIPTDSLVCNGIPTSGTYANSVVLGYMSDASYERAYIKK